MAQASIDVAEINRSGQFDKGYELEFDEIREETLQTETQNANKQNKFNAFCNLCFVLTFRKIYALYLCYLCKKYVCGECYERHDKSHLMVELESKKDERETRRREFLGGIRKERKRGKKFERGKVTMVDRVNVKHGLDQRDCYIFGLCGLNNTSWVVSDCSNYCIKIFCVGSNLLQRYIRIGSKPLDVTEIKVKNEQHTEQGVMSTINIPVTKQVEPDKPCLLAVTLPAKRKLLIIDVTQNPAIITKSLETKKHCYSIDYNEYKIFTLCRDHLNGDAPWFVSVMSTDGVTINTINTHLHPLSYPSLAVCPGRFYLTDPDNHKVFALNDEGKVVSRKTIQGSWPDGISVDSDTNEIYSCARHHNKLYRLDSSLESLESLFEFKSVNSEELAALCLYRDKLYVSHVPLSTHGNYISVMNTL